MEISNLQNKVIENARSKLKNEPWFRGVCLDLLPTDKEIEIDGIEESANLLVTDTVYWDATNSGFFS